MRCADPIVERFLPEVVDTLRGAAAVAKSAEGELVVNASGKALELLFDQQTILQSALSLLGWTLIDLAERARVNHNAISRYETRRNALNMHAIEIASVGSGFLMVYPGQRPIWNAPMCAARI